ncbi:hypothetical protein I8H89_03555 [Candidatus Saccharibacteria bacterium]|nr:hypothetical protein [Candidatus Saccharibacteria bacterium]
MVKTRKHQEISPFLAATLASLVVVAWLVNLISTLAIALRQWFFNSNLSAFYTTFLYEIFLPMLIFFAAMAYRRRKSGGSLILESVFVAFIVWIVATTISRVSHLVLNQLPIAFTGDLDWWYLEIIVCGVSTVATVAVLWYAHKLGKW